MLRRLRDEANLLRVQKARHDMRLPRHIREEQLAHRATALEVQAIIRKQRARRRAWWWAEHQKLVVGLIAFAVATVALGILIKVW